MIIFSYTNQDYDENDIDRVLHFSKNHSLGKVEFVHKNADFHIGSDSSGESACGDVLVPRGTVVHLEISNSGCVDLSGLSALHPNDVDRVDFMNCEIEDFQLRYLRNLTGLKSLSFDTSKITDFGLAIVGTLEWLNFLSISNPEVTDFGLSQLTDLKLKYLYLKGANGVTDAGLQSIANMSRLEHLSLPKSITDAGLPNLANLKLYSLYADATGCSREALEQLKVRGVAQNVY